MTIRNKQLKKSASAAWAGLMIGDALGAPAEFCYHEDIIAEYPEGLREMVPGFGICTDRRPGVVTDDTHMAYCLHLALQDAQGWNPAAALKRYREWQATDPPDIGEATEAALSGHPNAESQGNGALMRVMPIALWAAAHPGFDWQTAAREDAALTHPHPICGEANMVFVHALLQAMQAGATASDIVDSSLEFAVVQGMSEPLIEAIANSSERPDYDGESIGWVLVALQGAFYQLQHASTFHSALVDVVTAGGDTDTNAAITGTLIAAWRGLPCLYRPWLAAVRAANSDHFTALLPTVDSIPPYPILLHNRKRRSPRLLSGLAAPINDWYA